MANPPLPNDLFLAYKAISKVHRQVQIDPDKESTPSGAPSQIFVTVYEACVGVGFRRYLPWIMTEYCTSLGIAPSQLVLRAWGLINALQVLSDLTGITLSGSMIRRAFHIVPVEGNRRRFDLQLREGQISPVNPPLWVDANANGGPYFFVIHSGIGHIRHQWSDIGRVLEDVIPAEAESFPEALFDFDEKFRDPAFLLQPRVVDQTSLNASPERPFILHETMENLIPARMMYEFFLEVPEPSSDDEISDEESPDTCPLASHSDPSQVLVSATNPLDLLREERFLAEEIEATNHRLEQIKTRYIQVQNALRHRYGQTGRNSSEAGSSRNVRPRGGTSSVRPRGGTSSVRPRGGNSSVRPRGGNSSEAGCSRNVRPRRSS